MGEKNRGKYNKRRSYVQRGFIRPEAREGYDEYKMRPCLGEGCDVVFNTTRGRRMCPDCSVRVGKMDYADAFPGELNFPVNYHPGKK